MRWINQRGHGHARIVQDDLENTYVACIETAFSYKSWPDFGVPASEATDSVTAAGLRPGAAIAS